MVLHKSLLQLFCTNDRAKQHLKSVFQELYGRQVELTTEGRTAEIAKFLFSDLSPSAQSILIQYFQTPETALIQDPLHMLQNVAQSSPSNLSPVLLAQLETLSGATSQKQVQESIDTMKALADSMINIGAQMRHTQLGPLPPSLSTAASSSPSSTPGLSETPNSMQNGASEMPLPPIPPAPAVAPSASTSTATTATPTPTPSVTLHPVSSTSSNDDSFKWMAGKLTGEGGIFGSP